MLFYFYSFSGLPEIFLVWSQRLPLFTVAISSIQKKKKKSANSAVLHFCMQTVRLPQRALIKFTKSLWETAITLLYRLHGNSLFSSTLFPPTYSGSRHCLSLSWCYWVHSKPTDSILQLYWLFLHATYLCMQSSDCIRNTIVINTDSKWATWQKIAVLINTKSKKKKGKKSYIFSSS